LFFAVEFRDGIHDAGNLVLLTGSTVPPPFAIASGPVREWVFHGLGAHSVTVGCRVASLGAQADVGIASDPASDEDQTRLGCRSVCAILGPHGKVERVDANAMPAGNGQRQVPWPSAQVIKIQEVRDVNAG
jgi:hypothetical protein